MVESYKPIYSVKETAKILKVNTDSVYALIRTGQLTGLKLGSIRVRGSDLERFIEKYPAMTVEVERHGEV